MKSVALGSSGSICAVIIALWSSPAPAASERKTLTLPAGELQTLRIDADEGSLNIQGVPGLQSIEVVADVVVGNRRYRLTLEQKGDVGVLVADIDGMGFLDAGSRIDLTVRTPDRMALEINDDSGATEIRGMRADTTITDDSGGLSVRDHRGNLKIRDDSGDIDVQDVVGNVDIGDDSGSLTVANITGDVSIRDDSGGIRITDVTGHVSIRDDSGGITVANVSKGLTVHRDGSGGVSTSNIQGGVDIRR